MIKRIIFVSFLCVFVCLTVFWIDKSKKEQEKEKQEQLEQLEQLRSEIVLVEDLTVPFLKEAKVSDFVSNSNATLVRDYKIDTSKLGKQNLHVEFQQDDFRVGYDFTVEVVDITPPTVFIGNSYSVKVGSQENFVDKIFCGDDADSNPKCTIEGDYDLNTVGTYPVLFKAEDASGNQITKNINLSVYKPTSSENEPPVSSKTPFEEVVKNYKTENTKIGIDVSRWQGNIDFDALKEAGVEFIMIRVGTTNGTGGKYVLDPYFIQNIENAKRVGIPVGIYFYSYASNPLQAYQDAKWVIEQIKDYQIDLPIAFDWENWSYFNDYDVSFYELTNLANIFLGVVKRAGYQGMLYSSKFYLENIWLPTNYPTWLAHYTKKTNYQGEYQFWQLCSDGRVNGIHDTVDINVWYLNSQE